MAVDTNVDGLLEKNRQLAEQKKEVLRLEADTSAQEAKAASAGSRSLQDLQKTQQLILATKQPILDIDPAAAGRSRDAATGDPAVDGRGNAPGPGAADAGD